MITLLSDFGYQDAYVAVMKGVIASIAPGVGLCDLTHHIPPQDILAARFNLMSACAYFPVGTVHLAVVDPGVGSQRRAIALQYADGFLVGPDNGLFSGVLQQASLTGKPLIKAVTLTNARYWRSPHPSATFHGRDIFAPAAAYLAKGVEIDELGDRIDPSALVQPTLPPLEKQPVNASALYIGSIQYIDGFGNLITNIPAKFIPNRLWQITLKTPLKTHRFSSIKTYSDVPNGTLSALIGSHGWIEIACVGGSAAAVLKTSGGAAIGTPIELRLVSKPS